MRALFGSLVLALLFALTLGQEDLPEFVPCSFSVSFKSNVYNPDGEVVASSTDRIMRDHEKDLWRWDSDFTGMAPLLDPQSFIIIWRTDLNTSYHDYGDKCVINDGHSTMAPLLYDWLLSRTYGMDWFRHLATWEGLPAYMYRSTFVMFEYNTTMTADVYTLQENGALVFINGTAKSEEHGIDLTYSMEVDYYEHNREALPTYFIPSPHCTDGQPISAPSESSVDFQKKCYGARFSSSNADIRVVSWALILLLVSVLLF